MAIRDAQAIWEGTLREGAGVMKFGNGAFEGPFSYLSRFEEGEGTNPEELLGAAHAGCFSMSLSSRLTNAGHPPVRISTQANVHFGRVDGKAQILKIELFTEAEAPGISSEKFLELAEDAKLNCPISMALQGMEINLSAKLI
jgi:osmotically inducible protein OsmC